MPKFFRDFKEQALPTLYQHIWAGVIVVVGASLLGVLVWLRSYIELMAGIGIGILCASAIFAGLIALLICREKRRHNELEQSKLAKFFSQEKGYLDHRVNMEEGLNQLRIIRNNIHKEIEQFQKDIQNATQKTESASGNSKKLKEDASHTAKRYSKHFTKMEQLLDEFEKSTNISIEGTRGYFLWVQPKTQQDKEALQTLLQKFTNLLNESHQEIINAHSYQDAILRLKGISQDLNTVLNRGVCGAERYIVIEFKLENLWSELLAIVDKKIATFSVT